MISVSLSIDSLDFTCNTCQPQSIPFNCLNDVDFSKTIGSTDTSIEQVTKKKLIDFNKISFILLNSIYKMITIC